MHSRERLLVITIVIIACMVYVCVTYVAANDREDLTVVSRPASLLHPVMADIQ